MSSLLLLALRSDWGPGFFPMPPGALLVIVLLILGWWYFCDEMDKFNKEQEQKRRMKEYAERELEREKKARH